MKLLSLATRGVGMLPDREWSFAREGEVDPLTLVTGSAGAGKTTLLEAIVAAKELVGPYGGLPRHLRRLRRPDVERAEIAARWQLTSGEQATVECDARVVETVARIGDRMLPSEAPPRLRALFAETQPAPSCGGVAWFHAHRALGIDGNSTPGDGSYAWLLDDNQRFAGLVAWAAQRIQLEAVATVERAAADGMAFGVADGFKRELREAAAPFLVGKAVAGVRLDEGRHVLTFVDRGGLTTTAAQLSAQERQGLLFVLSFLARPAQHGIVLIDEPELHVHPADERTFLASVVALAPDAQVIVATSAPAVGVQGARALKIERRGA